jgi:hypothetical protein
MRPSSCVKSVLRWLLACEGQGSRTRTGHVRDKSESCGKKSKCEKKYDRGGGKGRKEKKR